MPYKQEEVLAELIHKPRMNDISDQEAVLAALMPNPQMDDITARFDRMAIARGLDALCYNARNGDPKTLHIVTELLPYLFPNGDPIVEEFAALARGDKSQPLPHRFFEKTYYIANTLAAIQSKPNFS